MREKVRLNDIAIHSKGKQIKGTDLIEDGKYDYLNGGINPSGKWNEYNNKGNTVTISEGGNSSGYVNYMEDPFWCGAHCYYLYDVKENSKYLYYSLKSKQEQIMNLRTGATMPNIKKSVLGEFVITYDKSPEEQEIVVQILEKTEKIIKNRKTQIKELDDLIKSRFAEMFGDDGYDIISLGELCSKISDGTHKTPKYQGDGITFISAKNIKNGRIDFTDVKYILEAEYIQIQNRCQLEKGDILLSKSGSLGAPVIVNTSERLGLFESLAVIKADWSKFSNIFLCEQLKTDEIQRQFKTGTKGVAIKHLHLNVIRSIMITNPPIVLQNQFADFVVRVDKLKSEVQKSLEETQELFDSLMQKYFD